MKYLFLFFLVFSTIGGGLKKASRINNGVQQASQFYHREQYQQAASLYRFLSDSLQVKDDELRLNLAHATYQAGDKNKAHNYYMALRTNPNPEIQAAVLNQLGVLAFNNENPEKALYYFKNAIIQNPLNDISRFNYELVQKYLLANPIRKNKSKAPDKNKAAAKPQTAPQSGQKPAENGNPEFQPDLDNAGTEPTQEKPAGNQQNNSENKNQGKKLGHGEQEKINKGPAGGPDQGVAAENPSPTPGALGQGGEEAINEKEKQMQTLRQRLSKTDISAEKANMLLEAMRQAELQYLQQLPRPPSRRPNKNKPDW